MRFLANENVSGSTVDALRERGHDVVWVRTEAPGSSDQEVLARAQTERRVIITFDTDFGELAYRWGLPAESGIVLFRFTAQSSRAEARIAVAALESRNDWVGHFAVVERYRIRMRPMPSCGAADDATW